MCVYLGTEFQVSGIILTSFKIKKIRVKNSFEFKLEFSLKIVLNLS